MRVISMTFLLGLCAILWGTAFACPPPDPDISPASRYIYDGESGGTFTVINDDGATAWSWDYELEGQPAGCSPSCSFTPVWGGWEQSVSTKWYAYPDWPNHAYDATYGLHSSVTINGSQYDAYADLNISLPMPGGTTSWARYTGSFTIAYAGATRDWYVLDNTFSRQPGMKMVYLVYTSQFYNKVVAHENEHLHQWNDQGGLAWQYFQPANLWYEIKDMRSEPLPPNPSLEEIYAVGGVFQVEVSEVEHNWGLEQYGMAWNSRPVREEAAYAVSNPMYPGYGYQDNID